MGFRKNKDLEWNNWLKDNLHYLIANCGIPKYIVEDKKRWNIFLDHGYDEIGWYENKHSAWSIEKLSINEAQNLFNFIKKEYPDKYAGLLDEIARIFKSPNEKNITSR